VTVVCLLVVCAGILPEAPLVVAANRDERLDRPATAATVLRSGGPRIIGGRDQVAGGTWLAVNEHGVVAALTNCPMPAGRDPAKRSRGRLPLALARHRDAERAAVVLADQVDPAEYNPCWLVVGDRRGLWYLDLTGPPVTAVRLPAGVHVLENHPLPERSAKVDRVHSVLGRPTSATSVAELVQRLRLVLADHEVPGGDPDAVLPGTWRPAAVSACCVHTPDYGTRSSAVVTVGADGQRPTVLVADGSPCRAPFADVGWLWGASRQQPGRVAAVSPDRGARRTPATGPSRRAAPG